MENKEFSIIIPVAGIGKRMKSYGPKALIRIGDTNVLGRQLNILQDLYPKNDIVVVAGFEDNKIKEFVNQWKNERVVGSREIKVVTNKNFLKTNVAKSIALATEFCNKDNYLIVYGDLVFTPEVFELNWQRSGVLLDDKGEFDKFEAGVVINQETSKITRFCYDTVIKWSQICFLMKNDMDLFLELLDSKNKHKFFTFEILNLMLELTTLKPYFNNNPKAKIVELDYSENIQKAKKLAKGEL